MSAEASPRNRALFALCLILPLAVYAAWAARLIRAGVGYEMDEAIYVESAVYLLRGSGEPPFVHEPAAWLRFGDRQLAADDHSLRRRGEGATWRSPCSPPSASRRKPRAPPACSWAAWESPDSFVLIASQVGLSPAPS